MPPPRGWTAIPTSRRSATSPATGRSCGRRCDGTALPLTAQLSAYRLEALVGQGGMAEVYRAVVLEGPRAGQHVAVKRLRPDLARDPGFLRLFEQEAEITRRLRHPGIVEVLETGFAGGTPFIVMD